MSMRHESQPYMIYTGPRPQPAAPPDPTPAEIVVGHEPQHFDTPTAGSQIGNGLAITAVLAVGVAIGIWVAPSVRLATAQPEPRPLALALTRPTETPVQAFAAPDAGPMVEELSATTSAEPAAEPRAPEVRLAQNTAAPPKARHEPVKRSASRKEAARSLPTDMSDARGDPVADLIASVEDPPH